MVQVGFQDMSSVIIGAIIDDNHLEILVCLCQDRIEGLYKIVRAIVCRQNYAEHSGH